MLAASPHTTAELSVVLLPEFGWTIQDQPVYGPGSVFQGYVQLTLEEPVAARQIRVVFHADESTIQRGYREQFFGTQRILWENKTNNNILGEPSYRFYFTIQMPLVQFPPSMLSDQYRCAFKLTAHLDLLEYPSIQVHKPVLYMPFIETRLLKTPLVFKDTKHNTSASFKVCALDYVPGDVLTGTLKIDGEATKVSMELRQILTLNRGEQQYTKIMTSSIHKISNTHTKITLDLPQDLAPSFSYGRVMSVAYKLSVKVERKGALRSKQWTFDLPITIGTLGYGIRASDELQLYTSFRGVFDTNSSNSSDPLLPVPRFMRAIEYEESLPVYESDRLPSYDTAIVS
ncbi:hypothetical protein DFQ28_004911 [Apophysomyces sp. BC1034]|nr:hypothetical protein DFQ30_007554 [Apophysomyces sp. BC1015]KAG0171744.1 hypothetical protein DFQ29_008697 [Apophysomyces sp. BC1021]KAG0188394.1 hypothetical protein DFQ28_004911 [Apophysomyces sp. BC1034]